MKFYTSSELFSKLKKYNSEKLVFLHIFPSYDYDIYEFYSYLCDVRSAIALSAMLPTGIRYTYKLK